MSHCPTRRRLLRAAALVVPAAALPGVALAAPEAPRRLRFEHTHTGEKLDVVYHDGAGYLPDAMTSLDHLLRDFRNGEVVSMDRGLIDLLHTVQLEVGGNGAYQIISAYRSPATNEMLRQRGGGVARRSLHMLGQAIDVRLPGIATRDLRDAALAQAAGGVGYYPGSDFVHLDTGRVRRW